MVPTRDRGRESFASFVMTRYSALYRTAFLVLGDHERAERMLHDTLVHSYLSWPRIPLAEAESDARRHLIGRALARAVDAGAVSLPGRLADVGVEERARAALHHFEHVPSPPGSAFADTESADLLDHVVVPPVDIDELEIQARTQLRRRRLRRITAGLGALAVSFLVLATTAGGIGSARPPDPPRPPPDGLTEGPFTYAQGRVLHIGPQPVPLPRRVVEVHASSHGVVVVTSDRRVWALDEGEPRQVGREEATLAGAAVGERVAGSATGDRVAWLEPLGARHLSVVVLDVGAGRVVRRVPLTTGAEEVASPVVVVGDDVFLTARLHTGWSLPVAWDVSVRTGVQSPASASDLDGALFRASAR